MNPVGVNKHAYHKENNRANKSGKLVKTKECKSKNEVGF